jgi:hypothetical protein
MENLYGGVIWTNHALKRLRDRGVSQSLAHTAFKNPDTTQKDGDTTMFRKRIDNTLVCVVAKQNEKKEWVVLSAWMDPPASGSVDQRWKEERKRYNKASALGKFLLTIKSQLGL